MIEITDKTHQPTLKEITEYINNPLFSKLNEYMNLEYSANQEIAYSGDKVLLGWNIRYYKAGKTLCRLYPRTGYFSMLVVVGKKEKDRALIAMDSMCEEMRQLFNSTKEGMGQRWLVMDFKEENDMYNDVLKLIKIRRDK